MEFLCDKFPKIFCPENPYAAKWWTFALKAIRTNYKSMYNKCIRDVHPAAVRGSVSADKENAGMHMSFPGHVGCNGHVVQFTCSC